MFAESQVIVGAMVALMKMRAIPSLAVHDSLIVPQEHEAPGREALMGVIGIICAWAIRRDC